MNQTIDWVNTIITELVNPNLKLKETLLKVQVLAFKIKNSKLKEWTDNELNGYSGKDVPQYRKIPSFVIGNLTQDRGFGMLTQNRHPLPIEYLRKELREKLEKVTIKSSVSELEYMIAEGGQYQSNIPHFMHNEITKLLANDWIVNSAWQEISLNNVEGIISAIKSNLLNFLLELAEEIGENENIEIVEHKKKIDNLFDKTIGNLTGETINISIGTDNLQSINTGDNSKMNIAKGQNIDQVINTEAVKELTSFINEFKTQLEKLALSVDDKKDIENEISRIETQIKRDKPKYPIINSALNVINGILVSVAGNELTPPIIEKLGWIIGQFS